MTVNTVIRNINVQSCSFLVVWSRNFITSKIPHAALHRKIIQRNRLQHAKGFEQQYHRSTEQVHSTINFTWACSNLRINSRGNRHTVKAGHYIVLAAITSKFIWTPEQETEETDKRKEGVSLYKSYAKPTTVITGVSRMGQLDQYV